jgi:hypothetical protein
VVLFSQKKKEFSHYFLKNGTKYFS